MKNDENVWVTVARYLAFLSALPAAILLGYGIGWWLDGQFSTHYLRFVFVVIGTVAGFVPIIWEVSHDN